MKKRHVVLFSVVAVIGLAILVTPKILFPKYEAPKVTGTHEVCVATDTWEDENRKETYSTEDENRSVTVKFWYPKEAGNYPLVVFSHGSTGVIDSNVSTCTELASHGYVVVSIGHTYQAMFVEDVNGKKTFIDGEFFNQVMTDNGSDDSEHERAVYEYSRDWMKIRTGDVNFVLDTIIEKCDAGEADVYQKIDLDKIGLFGHSTGMTATNKMERIVLQDVFYFEALDEKVFAYTKKEVYEIKNRLYEIEEMYTSYHFVRCSKSVVINLMLLDSISPALNGRFFAHMKNGEKLIISRQYASQY